MTEGELGEHVWQDATCQAPKTCSVCNLTEGDLIDHTWTEATCAEPKTCSVCGLEEGKTLAHKWEKATCTQPKTCAVCGLTEGDLAAHKWVKATCTKAQHCSVCEVIEGAPAEHNVAWEVTEKPTCTSKGTETGTCKVCKATFERAIDKLAHTPGNWAATDVTLLSGTVRYEQACKVCKNVVDSKDEKLTMGQINALGSAESYLSFMAFSQKGLVKQLEFEGFTKEEATFAADMCGADWFEQAAKSAESYLSFMSFSKSGLISQLKYEGFTQEQAEYGAAQNGY
ncbi:MAG: Ltp family lipoprotein [Clostridia bacterium]|nr:Ltp family lipoprotein [Clostridia bacterium]